MPRVESKNLFNFPLSGKMDEDLLKMQTEVTKQYETEESKAFTKKLEDMQALDDPESELAYAKMFRQMVDGFMKPILQNPYFVKYAKQTIVGETLKVPTTHDGDFGVPVEVYIPKKIAGGKANPAYIYAHGGGGYCGTAADSKPWLDVLAVEGNMIVFNVDYRIAPETKCPNNVKDFYEAIKYIKENAESLGVDPDRICIAGDSGGGYICLGAMVLLAQNDETDLVKLAIPGIPMVDDYCFSEPASMTTEERTAHLWMRKCWKLIAADLEAQKNDPLLFPGKVSDELLSKFPPTIINEVEFDMFITESTRLATRLRRAGRLLELIVIPGATHISGMMPELECSKIWISALKTAIEEYLVN